MDKQINQTKPNITQLDTHPELVHTRTSRSQHQHTDCIYSQNTGLHENYNNEMILTFFYNMAFVIKGG
jgi:hypothetical protein